MYFELLRPLTIIADFVSVIIVSAEMVKMDPSSVVHHDDLGSRTS
jgi:hypothetical protein